MIDLILHDSETHAKAFTWSGPLSLSAIEQWERRESLIAPPDLKKLWTLKGGGELFDTETILLPFATDDYDLVMPVSTAFWTRGLDTAYCVFHLGIVDSVFRKSDGGLFSLNSSDFSQMLRFRDLDEWYLRTLRSVYAEQYGLGPGD